MKKIAVLLLAAVFVVLLFANTAGASFDNCKYVSGCWGNVSCPNGGEENDEFHCVYDCNGGGQAWCDLVPTPR